MVYPFYVLPVASSCLEAHSSVELLVLLLSWYVVVHRHMSFLLSGQLILLSSWSLHLPAFSFFSLPRRADALCRTLKAIPGRHPVSFLEEPTSNAFLFFASIGTPLQGASACDIRSTGLPVASSRFPSLYPPPLLVFPVRLPSRVCPTAWVGGSLSFALRHPGFLWCSFVAGPLHDRWVWVLFLRLLQGHSTHGRCITVRSAFAALSE